MYSFSVENNINEILELTHSPSYDLVSIDGLLPPMATISTVQATNRDGSILTNTRAEDRTIGITIAPKPPIELNRQKLYRYFPLKKEVTLYFRNQNRNVKINGIVESYDGSLFESKQTIAINIRCLNPYFKNSNSSVQQMSQVIDNFEFPFAITEEGKEFSYIDKQLSQIIDNTGDVDTGLIIEMEAMGTVVNPIIYDVVTRESFGLNITMQYGDVIRINTNVGNKKVELTRDGATTNVINNITQDNTWFTLKTGENIFTYACDEGEENLYINFYFSLMFEGV